MNKKIKIQIVSWLNGSVLFEYETKDNTVAKTVNEAIKSSANLSFANLHSADLSFANLHSANLHSANLSFANLHSADLRSANLSFANLHSADLHSANLSFANLHFANLRSANLSFANLHSADLHSANLSFANLHSAKNADWAIAMTRILPEGELIGYKKCLNGNIVKLRIPTEAKRSHAFGRKCRAEFAEVLEITKGSRKLKTAKSTYDNSFVYKVGEIVRPVKDFSDDWVYECASGIHFFITKIEAENYDV